MRGIGSAHGLDEQLNASGDLGEVCAGTHYGTAPSCGFFVADHVTVNVKTTPASCSSHDFCWQNPLPQGNALLSIWGTDDNNVWAVGDAGTVLKWDGKAWTAQSLMTNASLSAVWGTDAKNVWVVGGGGMTWKWTARHGRRSLLGRSKPFSASGAPN